MTGQNLVPQGSVAARVCRFVQGRSVRAYLVGGYVRDRLLGRESHDVDFAVEGDALGLARTVADWMRGAFVPLDDERGTGRVVTRDEHGQRLFVDFAVLQGRDITVDLSRRDFTIDAIALDINDLSRFIDPYDGRGDLEAGLVRAVSEVAFRDDPLRTLRAVRLAAELGLRVEPRTEELIRRDAGLIAAVSAERVRDELSKTLAQPGAADNLRYLDELGLLGVILPETEGVKEAGRFERSLEMVTALEHLYAILLPSPISNLPSPISILHSDRLLSHLSQFTSGDRQRRVLLKLVAFLCGGEGNQRDSAARLVGLALRRLRFSRGEVNLGRAIVAHRGRLGQLRAAEAVTRRDVYRFFRDTGKAGLDLLLLFLADQLAAQGMGLDLDQIGATVLWEEDLQFAAALLRDYYERHAEVISPPKLISGDDLKQTFGLEEGPRLGEVLEAVREAQAAGEIRTRREALDYVERVWL
ncbi:MAG: CCA tRNA nucleotidyltransferase [Anaerolineae bacterium]